MKTDLDGYVVDFNDKTCTCRMWELRGIPCPHAISAIYYIKDALNNYVSHCFKVAKAKEAYGFYLKGVNGEKMRKKQPYKKFEPSAHRRMPGRPMNQRHRESHKANKNNCTT